MVTQQRSRDQRREAILKAATDLFLEQGYDRTSLEQIIERAGGSRRTIYQHFGNKEGLFVAVVEAILEHLLERLSMLNWQQNPPEEALVEAGTAFVKALTAPETLATFRMLLTEITRFPHLGETFFRNGPDLTARQLLEMMKGDLQLRALLCPENLPTKEEIEVQVRFAVQRFLKSVHYKPSANLNHNGS
ncbi:MAG: TetR family transcriptional regulator [Cyanobacteria bacterium]|jgi:AcrR family transcriptional regulator|nr:TetR family transcriptional regulator [Cyanobacteria bacterium GSL.Bin21]